jgi:processive 1,2-diacylglycerol beta-glucosyltransferase
VRTALEGIEPTIECETVDSYEYAASVFAKVVADGYIGMVKTVPQVYAYLYGRVERAKQIPAARRFVNAHTAANLRALIERMQPDLVVCTHAFPCGVMSEYKRRFDPTLPVVGIVTDYVVHPFWLYPNIDVYAVATPEMRRMLLGRGILPERVLLSGIPVDARFGEPRLDKHALRTALGLPVDRHVVLIMGGGIGIGPLDTMMRALGSVRAPLAAAVIVGRNGRLQKRVIEAAERTPYPLRVFGFVENVHDFMHASDVLLSKPGGLTSSEALAARLPMVLVKPLPGPEERNARYLLARNAALAATARTLANTVTELLDSPERRCKLQAKIDQLRRPQGAVTVARRIAALLQERRPHNVAVNVARTAADPSGRDRKEGPVGVAPMLADAYARRDG